MLLLINWLSIEICWLRNQLLICITNAHIRVIKIMMLYSGEDGPSQMALEDLAMFRAIPGSTVFYPSDGVSAERAAELAARTKGICFIRTSRPTLPVLYNNDEPFQIGKAKVCLMGLLYTSDQVCPWHSLSCFFLHFMILKLIKNHSILYAEGITDFNLFLFLAISNTFQRKFPFDYITNYVNTPKAKNIQWISWGTLPNNSLSHKSFKCNIFPCK